MKAQFDNKLESSFLLYLDHQILNKGEAFTNINSLFYKTKDRYSNLFTYSLPYSQIVNDASIPNCNIMTGVYLNGSFITKGQNNFVDVDYSQGKAYFSAPITGILSGNYAIKDFNVLSVDKTELELLTETKFTERPKTNQVVTGLGNNTLSYPCILIKNKNSYNEPFEFGGTDTTKIHMSIYIFSDSLFKLDAVTSIIRDMKNTNFGLLSDNELPFNAFGGLKTGYYDYNSISYPKIIANSGAFICETKTVNFGSLLNAEFKKINPEVHSKVLDVEIDYVRNPHE